MSNPHYSLRWNNHQSHLLTAFDSLLQNETLVDVTLICEESSFKAHKVVLSACSPYFQRIFSETPCKHPVIVLKDLKGWEIQAIVDFMYRGEISVGQEQLPTLIKAAESLQVRGLAHTERIPVGEKEISREQESRSYSPGLSTSEEAHSPKYETYSTRPLRDSSQSSFNGPQDRQCTSPLPRRKQARPRRRSGDCGAQDLSRKVSGSSFINGSSPEVADLSLRKIPQLQQPTPALTQSQPTSIPLQTQPSLPRFKSSPTPPAHNNNNLCWQLSSTGRSRDILSTMALTPRRAPPLSALLCSDQTSDCIESEESNGEGIQSQPVELTVNHQEPPPPRLDFLEPLPLPPQHHESLDSAFPPHLASMSQLSLTPPHMFSLESSLGLFPGLENCRGGLLGDLAEPRIDNHHMPVKKKRRCFVVGRPKGQHSAPRGGPPRSWTNAELTEALQHVWNKKMTTSQASRIFGIPYNSLLMYVRGKYGKSLKLEQLKKECFGDVNGPLDLLGLGNIANNNNPTPKSHKIPEPDLMLGPPGFNPSTGYPTNFFPDFGSPFPVPVGMVHLLPQSEKNREPMNMSLDFSTKEDSGPLNFGKDDRPSGLDFGKGDHTSDTPLDFNSKNDRSPPSAPLDHVKEEHHNNIDSNEPNALLARHNGD